ncbi:MAG: hypothetical protein KDA79_07035 [Planctomycetaceae bacterium]|nr:hypothetical protein [Planctomycetaceae bacterium]
MAGSALVIAVLVVLAIAFVIDWQLQLDRLQRLVQLVIVLAALGWACYRWCLPWLRQQETELDVALAVEQRQHIESDLVAALQFESADAAAWGSPQLEQAVIRYVDDFSRSSLNVFEGFDWGTLRRRALPATVMLLSALALTLLYPGYASAFFNRLLLGSAHYPSATRIDQVLINGQPVDLLSGEPVVFRSPHGRPLVFEVHSSGVLPASGQVELEGLRQGVLVSLPFSAAQSNQRLPRFAGDPVPPAEDSTAGDGSSAEKPAGQTDTATTDTTHPRRGKGQYTARLPQLVDSARLQITLGDAWTDPRTIEVIPLPVVLPEVTILPPSYATGMAEENDVPPGLLQHSVLEGSGIQLAVRCANKELASAVVTVDGKSIPLVAEPGNRSLWNLTDAESPFRRITAPFEYRIQVTDADGLQLPRPVRGQVRLRIDREPRVAAAFSSTRYLPTAVPRLSWGAGDDFGISAVRLHVQVVRADGREDERVETVYEKAPATQPARRLRDSYDFDLGNLQLARGDELKVAVEAVDWRGDLPPKSTLSEPLILQITDREGILASLLESDERTARQLDAIIERQLGIGETR